MDSPIVQLDHVALQASDLAGSCAFYANVLKLRPLERPAFSFPGAWFALGISAQRDPTALQYSLYLYADAAASDDEELTETLRQHLIDNFELPSSMAASLRR